MDDDTEYQEYVPSGGFPPPGAFAPNPPAQEATTAEEIPVGEDDAAEPTHRLFPPGYGMWNHLAAGNIENARNQVFKRVEDPSQPHVYLPKSLKPGYIIDQQDIVRDQGGTQFIRFRDALKYAATGTRGMDENGEQLFLYSRSQIQRGEWNSVIGAIRWEHAGGSNNNHYCTHTLFPVKFTRTYAKKTDTFYMSYYVFYSSLPVQPNDAAFKPRYKDFLLSPDATVDGVSNGATVHIDMTLINDENAILAIVASCQNSYAMAGSYITFIPRIDESLYTSSVNWSSSTRYTFGGSSCGMAVFAAVKGWMSVLYTGYINTPVPGGKYVTNEEIRESMAQQRYGSNLRNDAAGYQSSYQDQPWYLRTEDQPNVNPQVTTAPSVISRVMAQPNFVESVGGIFSKIVYATLHHIPIFIPMQSSFRTDMVSYIARFRQSAKAIQWMGIVPTCYTAAMMEDGYPMLTRSDNGSPLSIAPNILMPLTITDANMLQLRFAITIAFSNTVEAKVGFAGGSIYRNAQISMFGAARQNMMNLLAQEGDARYAEGSAERRAVQEAKEIAIKQNLDRPAKYQLMKQTKEPFKVERARKAEQKLQAKKEVANRVKQVVDRLRQQAKAKKMSIKEKMASLKDQFMTIKKPSDDEKKDFAREMKALREQKPVAPKKQYGRQKGYLPNSDKFKKNPDGTYSDATKLAMKALKAKNNEIIKLNPQRNPELTTAEQRKYMAQQRGAALKRDMAALANYRKKYGSSEGQGNFDQLKSQASARGIVGDIAHGVGDVLDILDL